MTEREQKQKTPANGNARWYVLGKLLRYGGWPGPSRAVPVPELDGICSMDQRQEIWLESPSGPWQSPPSPPGPDTNGWLIVAMPGSLPCEITLARRRAHTGLMTVNSYPVTLCEGLVCPVYFRRAPSGWSSALYRQYLHADEDSTGKTSVTIRDDLDSGAERGPLIGFVTREINVHRHVLVFGPRHLSYHPLASSTGTFLAYIRNGAGDQMMMLTDSDIETQCVAWSLGLSSDYAVHSIQVSARPRDRMTMSRWWNPVWIPKIVDLLLHETYLVSDVRGIVLGYLGPHHCVSVDDYVRRSAPDSSSFDAAVAHVKKRCGKMEMRDDTCSRHLWMMEIAERSSRTGEPVRKWQEAFTACAADDEDRYMLCSGGAAEHVRGLTRADVLLFRAWSNGTISSRPEVQRVRATADILGLSVSGSVGLSRNLGVCKVY